MREIQRKSYDVDTRDIAGVRKHPGLTEQHINLATNTVWCYLLSTRSSTATKEALPHTTRQVLDVFITQLAAINFEQQKECVTSPDKVCARVWVVGGVGVILFSS